MKIYNGNNLEILKTFADNSIDSVVTDPPYGLSFMGKSWDYDVPKSETWREVLRVLKPGGHLLSFFGTRTYHRGVAAIEDAGFEIRDQIGWAYGSGFPKSHNLKGEWEGWGTALKPAWEPICVARKPFDCTVAENVLQHGTGAINIDRCRVEAIDGNSTARKPSMVNDTAAGFGKGKKMGGNGSELGRWPANLIHDGSEEVLAQFPESKGQMGRAKDDGSEQGNKIYGAMKHGTKQPEPRGDSGSAARFFASFSPDLFLDCAKGILYVWKKYGVNVVDDSLPLPEKVVGSVLNDVVMLGSRGDRQLSGVLGLSTRVTPKALNALCENAIKQMVSTAPEYWPASFHISTVKSKNNLAKSVDVFPPTDTTMITENPTSSDGCAAAVIFITTLNNTAAGVRGSRIKYCAKTSKADREDGCVEFDAKRSAAAEFRPNHTEKADAGQNGNPYGRWTPLKNNHATVKPTDLMRYLCRLVTPPGGTVLDPFMGSGSTGKAAILEGFDFIGIELDAEYCKIANARIEFAKGNK